MSHNITVEGGKSVRLPTKGKYCDRDIVITATGSNAPTEDLDTVLTEQEALIAELQEVLEGKAAGGGGNTVLEDALVGGTAKETLTEYTNERVTSVRNYIFDGFINLQAVNIPNVETVGAYAFSECSNLTEIDLQKCTTIGSYSFQSCKALTKVNLPLLQTVGSYAFSNDAMLSDVNMPLVTNIERQGFYYCTALGKLDFSLLNTIAVYCFTNSRKLNTVIIRTPTVCSLQNTNAFNGTAIASGTGYVYVPRALLSDDDATKDYRRATNWSTLASQFRPLVATVADLASIDGSVYNGAWVDDENCVYIYDGSVWAKGA